MDAYEKRQLSSVIGFMVLMLIIICIGIKHRDNVVRNQQNTKETERIFYDVESRHRMNASVTMLELHLGKVQDAWGNTITGGTLPQNGEVVLRSAGVDQQICTPDDLTFSFLPLRLHKVIEASTTKKAPWSFEWKWGR